MARSYKNERLKIKTELDINKRREEGARHNIKSNKDASMKYFSYFFYIIIGWLLYRVCIDYKTLEKPKSGLFHHRYGGSVCGEFIEAPCGITLKKCSDDKEYYCLRDVNAEFDKVSKGKKK